MKKILFYRVNLYELDINMMSNLIVNELRFESRLYMNSFRIFDLNDDFN